MSKKSVTITVDENLWAIAKDKLPCSRSEFFETQAKLFLDIEDPEKKIMENIQKKENEINALKDKLCSVRKAKHDKLESDSVFDTAMIPLQRLHDKQGAVGRNQIRNIAHKNDIPTVDLEKNCKEVGFVVNNFMEVPKY